MTGHGLSCTVGGTLPAARRQAAAEEEAMDFGDNPYVRNSYVGSFAEHQDVSHFDRLLSQQ